MGWPFGEIKFAKHLEELREELESWYGQINELRMGVRPEKHVEKPYVAIVLEQMEQFGHLPEAGSINDQPLYLMRELELAKQVRTVFENSYRTYLKARQPKQ